MSKRISKAEVARLITPKKNHIETWKEELRVAGWKAVRFFVWKAPNGALFRGPYAAWRMMKSVEQWGGEPLGEKGIPGTRRAILSGKEQP